MTKTNAFAPCQCLAAVHSAHEEIVDNGTGATAKTGQVIYGQCGSVTQGTFAPGHDAKLKGVLLKLAVRGLPYIFTDGGMLVEADPKVELANRGWIHFLAASQAKFDRRVAAIAKKSDARVARKVKAAAKAAKVETPAFTVVKIGRWEYAIQAFELVANDMATVTYTDAKGNAKLAHVKRSSLS